MANEKNVLFEKTPIRKAVLPLPIPTVISQLITVIYNMADTFYIGQLGDPEQVAAATVAMPLFMILTALANLFGIGGASLISRCLGAGETEKAKNTACFCIWSGAVITLFYGILVFVFRPFLLPLLGAGKATYEYTYNYVFWTVTLGAVPTVLNSELAHLIRAQGYSKQASLGVAGGGILNIILDPIFIFVFKLEIVGAAQATMISNCLATAYFILFIYKKKNSSVITFNPKYFTLKKSIVGDVLAVGLPSCVISFTATISNSALNSLIASFSDMAVAGMGIAKKINLMAFAVAQGMTQGSLPLIGYNFTAKNKKRMNSAIKTTIIMAFSVSLFITAFLFLVASPVSRLFIKDKQTVYYAQHFLRIICLACPTTTLTLMGITIFQATGKKVAPLILSLFRKGGFDIPLMFLFRAYYGVNGIAWATPIADFAALAVGLCFIIPYLKKLNKAEI